MTIRSHDAELPTLLHHSAAYWKRYRIYLDPPPCPKRLRTEATKQSRRGLSRRLGISPSFALSFTGNDANRQRLVRRIANADRQADALDDRGGQIDHAEKLVIVVADAEIEPANSESGLVHHALDRIEHLAVRGSDPQNRETLRLNARGKCVPGMRS